VSPSDAGGATRWRGGGVRAALSDLGATAGTLSRGARRSWAALPRRCPRQESAAGYLDLLVKPPWVRAGLVWSKVTHTDTSPEIGHALKSSLENRDTPLGGMHPRGPAAIPSRSAPDPVLMGSPRGQLLGLGARTMRAAAADHKSRTLWALAVVQRDVACARRSAATARRSRTAHSGNHDGAQAADHLWVDHRVGAAISVYLIVIVDFSELSGGRQEPNIH
jgi:hypothetical protein